MSEIAVNESPDVESHAPTPLLVQLGSQSKRNIRELSKGKGKLLKKVNSTIKALQKAENLDTNALPVIVVVKEKKKKKKRTLFPY
jgi:hypothetical protein